MVVKIVNMVCWAWMINSHASYVTLKMVNGQHHTSHLTPHTSHLASHTSHLTPHTSPHTLPHTSHITSQTSHLTPHTSPHTSHLTSHITSQTSHQTLCNATRGQINHPYQTLNPCINHHTKPLSTTPRITSGFPQYR